MKNNNWRVNAGIGLIAVRDLGIHLVRIYENRIAIWRKDGRRLGWEELQNIKETIWGDRVAIEVYPAAADVVNLRHTRHLWWSKDLECMVIKNCKAEEFESALKQKLRGKNLQPPTPVCQH